MLYCPKCGTANRRGSRFCNECGELLPMHTGLRCPMCGAMNPIQNAYCDQCNARIVPMSAEQPESGQPSIRGVSLPTIPLDEKPSIPEPLDAASPEDTLGETEEADGWLAQFRETPDEGEAETAAEGTDGWLSQLRDSSAEPVEEPVGGPLEEGESDNWLSQLRDSAAEEEPAFAHEPAAEAEPVEPVEMPDWLQGLAPLGTEEPPAEPAPAAAEEFAPSEGEGPVPSEVEETFEMPAPAEVPDWLQDLAPAEPAPAAAEGFAPSEGEGPVPSEGEETFEMPAPAEVPDWLQDLAPTEPTPAAAEGFAPSEGEGPVPSEVEETFEMPAPAEVPDWLQDLVPAEPAPAAAEEFAPSEGEGPIPSEGEEAFEVPAPAEVPDWLQDLAPAEPAPAAAEGPVPSEGEGAFEMPAPAEVPDWLQDLAPAEPAPAAAEEFAPSEGEGPVPSEVEETFEMPAPAEMPDWLQDLAPAEPAPAAAEGPVPSEGEGAFEMPAPAEVPDWLQDLAPAEPAPAAAEGFAPSEGEGPVPSEGEETFEMPAPAEVPDWLQDMAPAEPAPAAAEEAAPEMPIPAEAPDWLKEAAPPSPLPFVDATSLDEAEPPEWLTGLKEAAAPSAPAPAGITPPFAIEPDTAAAEAAGLARAEIPAWLEAMRPTTEIVEEAVEEEPAETEGLLQGLRGVLTPLQMADLVSARKGPSPAEASEAILARAQLLQRLLSHPTEAPKVKPLKRTAGMSELAPRLLIAAVLFMVVAALLIPQYTDSYQPPTLTQPDLSSIADMYSLIEGINESDTVLVAFEYGPTQADELNLVAQPILEHLADRKATILIASTQAEGLAVAEALRNAINSQEKVASGVQAKVEYSDQSPGYRPGNATGAAQLLTSVDTDPSLIIVLAAQPEALRWWIEQTRVHYAGSPPPTAIGVSAALEIAASPYLDANANQLKGVVSGLGGATAYEARNRERHGEAEEPAHQLDALMAGQMVIIVSMLAGAAVYAAAGTRGREK